VHWLTGGQQAIGEEACEDLNFAYLVFAEFVEKFDVV